MVLFISCNHSCTNDISSQWSLTHEKLDEHYKLKNYSDSKEDVDTAPARDTDLPRGTGVSNTPLTALPDTAPARDTDLPRGTGVSSTPLTALPDTAPARDTDLPQDTGVSNTPLTALPDTAPARVTDLPQGVRVVGARGGATPAAAYGTWPAPSPVERLPVLMVPGRAGRAVPPPLGVPPAVDGVGHVLEVDGQVAQGAGRHQTQHRQRGSIRVGLSTHRDEDVLVSCSYG